MTDRNDKDGLPASSCCLQSVTLPTERGYYLARQEETWFCCFFNPASAGEYDLIVLNEFQTSLHCEVDQFDEWKQVVVSGA